MIEALVIRYGWEPGFWRRMGWREMCAWTHQMRRSREQASGEHATSPHSWAGRERDGFWVEQDRKRGRA